MVSEERRLRALEVLLDEIPKLNAEDQERLAQIGLEEPSRAGAAATVAAANSRDPEEYAADLARVSEVINAQSLSIPAGRAVMMYALALLGGPEFPDDLRWRLSEPFASFWHEQHPDEPEPLAR